MADNANEKMYELMAKHLTRRDVYWALLAGKAKALLFKCKMKLSRKSADRKDGEDGNKQKDKRNPARW